MVICTASPYESSSGATHWTILLPLQRVSAQGQSPLCERCMAGLQPNAPLMVNGRRTQ